MGIVHAAPVSRTAFDKGNLILDTDAWVDAGDSGSGLSFAISGGRLSLVLTMDGTDNDCEIAYYGKQSMDVSVEGRVLGFKTRFTLTEADTGNKDIDFFIGLSSVVGPTLWGDTDTLASGSYLGVAKYTASAFLRRIVQQGSTNSGDTSATTYAIATATEYEVEMHVQVVDRNGTDTISANFYATDITNNGARTQIGSAKVEVANTSYAIMRPVVALSTNGTNAEVAKVHEFVVYQN